MPSAIELFSGCGGLSTGLIAAGFEVLSAVEINQTAADKYHFLDTNLGFPNSTFAQKAFQQ